MSIPKLDSHSSKHLIQRAQTERRADDKKSRELQIELKKYIMHLGKKWGLENSALYRLSKSARIDDPSFLTWLQDKGFFN